MSSYSAGAGTRVSTRMRRLAFGEIAVFRGALLIALLHALDDALLNRQPGVPIDQHAVAAGLAVGIGAAILPARRASRLNVLDALQYE